MSVVGARPQFVKLAPISRQVQATSRINHVIVHTGQHYDPRLSDVFFRDLTIPTPDEHLNVGSASHGVQTGNILAALDPVLERHQPDCVLVYGDTNSTLAAALAAVKLHVPVAHLEAGLRSFNRRMPEEHNRVLVDHAADLLLAPTETAVRHLTDEGLSERSVLVGDVMVDVCYQFRDDGSATGGSPGRSGSPTAPYVVATIHRAENTDDAERLAAVLRALSQIETSVLLVAHPRLQARAESFGLSLNEGSLNVVDSMSYSEMIRTVSKSAGVVTDSGGLQKEAYLLGVPCTTLRAETEWTETLEGGWNVLDPRLIAVRDSATRAKPRSKGLDVFGDGRAASRVITAIVEFIRQAR